jgi:hypothetical protein
MEKVYVAMVYDYSEQEVKYVQDFRTLLPAEIDGIVDLYGREGWKENMVSLVYEFSENKILKMHELVGENDHIMTYAVGYHDKMVSDINILRDAFVEYVRRKAIRFAGDQLNILFDDESTEEEKESASDKVWDLFHYMFDDLEDDDKA